MDIGNIILKENNYAERMNAEVEPYLEFRRTVRWVIPTATVKKAHKKGSAVWQCNGGGLHADTTNGKCSRKIHVLCYRADRPKAVVIISHGFTEAEPKYHEMVYYFLCQQYTVYLPEHCGHGKSYRLTEDPSLVHIDHWERYVADFIKISHLAKRENPDIPLVLYGHSMGGGIVAAAASLAPELYDRIVLSSPMIRPLTGKLPWKRSAWIAHTKCLTGMGMRYLPGQKPYAGAELFSQSGGVSKPRFLRYDILRQEHRELQTCAASYRWLYESLRLSGYLLTGAYRRIQSPVLILRPQKDELVSLEAQEQFAEAINREGIVFCELEEFPDVRHELFNSGDDVLAIYWERVFDFIAPDIREK